ncbi:MAG: hypothetical protein WBP64_00750 [Nitrososphaeraceae archaeon]
MTMLEDSLSKIVRKHLTEILSEMPRSTLETHVKDTQGSSDHYFIEGIMETIDSIDKHTQMAEYCSSNFKMRSQHIVT